MKNKLVLKPYNKLEICPDCNQVNCNILVEILGVYDGGLYWKCKHCGTCWHRFPVGHYIRERADKWLESL